MKRLSSHLLVLSLLLVPVVVGAQDLHLTDICEGPECGFSDLVTLAKNVINALIIFSTFLATVAFAWAGVILLTSGGSPGKKDEAKKLFKNVLIGYLWILSAWLLIYTISSVLLSDGFSILGKPEFPSDSLQQ